MNIILKNTKKIFTSTTSNSGGGGITSVVGGTNITIDNTDPSNPIINGVAASSIIVVANYSALPAPNTVTGKFYWCSASQGTSWIPGSSGGTYYNSGMYYSNGTTWEYLNVPYQATQAEVNTGTNTDKFVTPATLAGWLTNTIVSTYQTIITYTSWGTFLHAATNKTTPIDADEVGIWDSVSGLLNRVSLSNLYTYIANKLTTATLTFTNKTIKPRIVTVTQSATPSINIDNGSIFQITGLAQAITSMTTNMTGTPYDGQCCCFEITDNGTARAITLGSNFIASTAQELPTTTVSSVTLQIYTKYRLSLGKHEVQFVN